jgi:MbtH protein
MDCPHFRGCFWAKISADRGGKKMREEREDNTIYKAVLNHEEQYSIWPADRENALGWKDAGKTGSKAECLAYIKEVWTDMRPLSLRKSMEQSASAMVQ